MQDIMDGFFPSELQIRYPDGVPFEVFVININSYWPVNVRVHKHFNVIIIYVLLNMSRNN